MDWPAAAYWRELAEHYPEAKVILTVRDPDRWYDSVSDDHLRPSTRRAPPAAAAPPR